MTDESSPNVRRTVTIPVAAEHNGHGVGVELDWVCLECGGPRGEPFDTLSYDGSVRCYCHGWTNPCGHVETYQRIRDDLEQRISR